MRPGITFCVGRWILVFIAGLAFCAPGIRGAETSLATNRQPRVLVLYSDDRLLPAGIAADEAIRSTFQAELDVPAEFYTEFMDVARFPGEAQQLRRCDYMRDRFSGREPDVIIAGGRQALNFLVQYRSTLFSRVPVVHCGVPPDELPNSLPDNLIVGIPHIHDVTETLELALRLQPDTRRVAIVDGINNGGLTQADVSSIASKVEFLWLTNRSFPQLRDELSRLPDHTVVFYGAMFRDPAGNAFTPRFALDQFAPASRVPIYGYYDTYLGHGIVGGSMVTFQTIGRSAAQIAIKILKGQNPQDAVHGVMHPPTPMFDCRELQRWGIDVNRLPPSAEIRFREPTLWEQHKMTIIGGTMLISFETALIGALVLQLRRRHRAEAQARQAELERQHTRDELAHVARVSTMGQLASTLAHELNQPLGAILRNAEAAELFLQKTPPDFEEVRAILSDIRQDDHRAGAVIDRMRALLKRRDLQLEPLALKDLFNQVKALIHAELEARRVALQVELPPDLPLVLGDSVQLQQVLLNLLINGAEAAIDMPPEQRRLVLRAGSSGKNGVEVCVSDTGHGIPADKLARIFEAFQTTKPNGLGLGLAISQTIINAHGGRIWAENNSGGGVSVRFILKAENHE